MTNVAVIGSQWGDEGKGKIVDWLSERADVVVRFQGGHNAGHTLVIDGVTYKLSLLPSGIVRQNKLSVIGNGVVVDPWALLAEIARLKEQGVDITPDNLRLAENACLILPLHGNLDRAREAAASGDNKIGTTGRGIGPAYEDRVGRRAIRVGDLADADLLEAKVENLLTHHNALLRGLGQPEVDGAELLAQLKEIAPKILPFSDTVWKSLNQFKEAGKRILFEGAQGTMLDIDHGTYPYVTSSNPTAGGACTGAGIGPMHITRVVGIAKSYVTRVGSGPFPTELLDELGDTIVEKGHEYGVNTKRRRRPGWFDAVMLRHAVRLNSLSELAITKLDILGGLGPLKVCVAYEFDGQRLTQLPYHQSVLHKVTPIYEELAGWDEDISGITERSALPGAARDYLDFLERQVGIPITLVGVGPGRDQYLHFAA